MTSKETSDRAISTRSSAVGPLTNEELLERFSSDGDMEARRIIIERHMKLVKSIARRYAHRGERLEDLVQAGSIGLLKAVDRFDSERGVVFATFAIPNISGEIKRHFRDTSRVIRVPRDLQELRLKINRESERLPGELGRHPTTAELAVATDSTEEDVLEALHSVFTYRPKSLDEKLPGDGETMDLVGSNDENFDLMETRLVLSDQLETLPEREQEVVRMRFYRDLTQQEIAGQIGVSQMHVSRILQRAIKRLHENLADVVDRSGDLLASEIV